MHQFSTCSIGLIQLTCGDVLEHNIAQSTEWVAKAAADGAQIVFLPENSFYMRREARQKDEKPIPAPLYAMHEHPGVLAAVEWAQRYGVWVVIGSIANKERDTQPLPYNRSVVVSPAGIVAYYDKLHLFDVTLPTGESYTESARTQPGDAAVVVSTPWGGVGLSVCYDVRFPQLYRELALGGADILSIPAAFTVPTGQAHWHVLQRARAIENGCFVVAAAQCGEHPGGRRSYGHSLVVNPWGEVLVDLGEAPGYAVVNIDLAEAAKARGSIPNLRHARPYQLLHRP